MTDDDSPEAESAALGARIAAAQARLGRRVRGDAATIGAALGALNDELDLAVNEDHDAARQRLRKIEARLRAEEIRLEDDAEDEEG